MTGKKQSKGAVSIFVVITTALLITVVTISFTRLMLRDQQRASDTDLSQSAYDAALAGVEDAKRALVRFKQLPSSNSLSTLDLSECNAISQILTGDSSGAEVVIGQSDLNQAYTCVKIDALTDDFIGSARADRTQLVPLSSAGQFDRVKIEWFNRDDIPENGVIDVPANGSSTDLPRSSAWLENRPPILETQLIQTDSSFNLSQFDDTAGGRSNTNTLFLYPKQLASSPVRSFMDDSRRNAASSPSEARCQTSLLSELYSCSVTIQVPAPIAGSAGSRSNAYLRIVPRYNATHFRVTMLNGSNPVQFDGVQPAVDSTGRANDLFRRVSARIEAGADTTAYPDAAVDVRGNFCKTFMVTDTTTGYFAGDCQPQ